MNRNILVVLLALVLLSPFGLAATEGPLITSTTTTAGPPPQSLDQLSQTAVDLRVSEANRFLSAEVSRQISTSQEQLLKAVNDNNDQNFRIFDDRMNQYMGDLKQKVIIGGIGAILIVNALIGLAYLYVTRRYSYEHYLEKQLDVYEAKLKKGEVAQPQLTQEAVDMSKGLEQMQQKAWAPQAPAETVSTVFGQAAASQMTDMNQWQFQPAYEGAWQRTEQPISHVQWQAQTQQQPPMRPLEQPDYVHPFEDVQQQYRNEGYQNGGY